MPTTTLTVDIRDEIKFYKNPLPAHGGDVLITINSPGTVGQGITIHINRGKLIELLEEADQYFIRIKEELNDVQLSKIQGRQVPSGEPGEQGL